MLDLPDPGLYRTTQPLPGHEDAFPAGVLVFVGQPQNGGTKYENMSLEEVVKATNGQASEKKIFNNAAQVWNHTFYWNCLAPKAGGEPTGNIKGAIDKSFGSFADFKTKFNEAAVAQFGSGWAWLTKTGDGGLAIETTPNAETPFGAGKPTLLTADVWEHAYYLDHRNNRKAFLEVFCDKLLNWDFVIKNLRG